MERRGLLRNCQNEGIDVHICPDEFLEKETRIKGRRKENINGSSSIALPF